MAAERGDFEEAGRLAGYARSVHPSLATRAGGQRAVSDRLYKHLKDGLTAEALDLVFAEGRRWPLSTAAERARQVLISKN